MEDLDKNALNAFRSKAVKNSRMSKSEVDVSDEVLLKNLKIYDGNYLNRAAILLFHQIGRAHVRTPVTAHYLV